GSSRGRPQFPSLQGPLGHSRRADQCLRADLCDLPGSVAAVCDRSARIHNEGDPIHQLWGCRAQRCRQEALEWPVPRTGAIHRTPEKKPRRGDQAASVLAAAGREEQMSYLLTVFIVALTALTWL